MAVEVSAKASVAHSDASKSIRSGANSKIDLEKTALWLHNRYQSAVDEPCARTKFLLPRNGAFGDSQARFTFRGPDSVERSWLRFAACFMQNGESIYVGLDKSP